MDTLKMLTVVSLALSFTCLLAKKDYRSENYTTGRSVNIFCTNKTWSEMIYTTWEIPKDRNHCTIAAHIDKLPVDNCLNGKVLRNTTNGESYLHIPLFKDTDEGIYKCETAYVGTSYTAHITVSARVSPQIYTRLDFRNGKREAVCSAEGGKPAASISWRNRWNSSVTQSTNENLDGSFTVESRLILPDYVSSGNLSCIITHPSWGEKHWFMSTQDNRGKWNWFWIIIPLGLISFIIAILIGLYIMRKHLGKLRNCWKSKIPAPPPPKTPQDVEEVEPYASYVQRINSIYNSSAELCNA